MVLSSAIGLTNSVVDVGSSVVVRSDHDDSQLGCNILKFVLHLAFLPLRFEAKRDAALDDVRRGEDAVQAVGEVRRDEFGGGGEHLGGGEVGRGCCG